jgi:hypothetical protein
MWQLIRIWLRRLGINLRLSEDETFTSKRVLMPDKQRQQHEQAKEIADKMRSRSRGRSNGGEDDSDDLVFDPVSLSAGLAAEVPLSRTAGFGIGAQLGNVLQEDSISDSASEASVSDDSNKAKDDTPSIGNVSADTSSTNTSTDTSN